MENRQKTDKRLKNLKTDAGPGRPLGQRNYATIYKEALQKLAEMNDMAPEDMETDILLKGIASARKGDYRFWKDIHDRIHGQAKQPMDITSDGNAITPVLVQFLNEPKEPDSNGDSDRV